MSTQIKNYDNTIFFSSFFVFFFVFLTENAAIHFEAIGAFSEYQENKANLVFYVVPIISAVWFGLAKKSERLAGKYINFAGGASAFLIFYNTFLSSRFPIEVTKLLLAMFVLANLVLALAFSFAGIINQARKEKSEFKTVLRIADLVQRHEPEIGHCILLAVKKPVEEAVLLNLPSNEKTNELIAYLIEVGHLKINELPHRLITIEALNAWRRINSNSEILGQEFISPPKGYLESKGYREIDRKNESS